VTEAGVFSALETERPAQPVNVSEIPSRQTIMVNATGPFDTRAKSRICWVVSMVHSKRQVVWRSARRASHSEGPLHVRWAGTSVHLLIFGAAQDGVQSRSFYRGKSEFVKCKFC
jgi:hypothetical protein